MEVIKEIVERNLTQEQLFLVDVVVSGNKAGQKVTVIIDGDNGVTIDDCAALSRAVSSELETLETFAGPFVLNVSSPGLDHPIKLRRQYEKNVGRNVKVVLTDGEATIGKLLKIAEEKVVIEKKPENKKEESKTVELPLSEIVKTNVLVSFK